MIPELTNLTTLQTRVSPSKTFRINQESNRVIGMVDGQEAIAQSIWLLLSTERYSKVTHTGQYGVEFERYIGKPLDYVIQDLERAIKEALSVDNRIRGIQDFIVTASADGVVTASFTVNTIEGSINYSTEVIIS